MMKRRNVIFAMLVASLFLSACKDNGNPINGQGSPQGKVVFVMSDTIGVDDFGNPVPGSVIFRMNLDGNGLTRLTLRGEILDTFQNRPRIRGSAGEPRWSRDGKKIVYSESLGPDESHIVMMNEDGSNKKTLTPVGGYCIRPKWSPQGDRILYLRGTYMGAIIATSIVDMNGSSFDLRILPESRVFEGDSVFYNLQDSQWHQDGEHLYVWGSVGKPPTDPTRNGEIFLFEISTGKAKSRLTRNNIDEWGFEMSPDGSQVLLVRGPFPVNVRIYFMSLADSIVRAVTTGPKDYWPRWENTGNEFVFLKDANPSNDPGIDDYQIFVLNPNKPFEEKRVSSVIAGEPDIFIERR